MPPQTEEVASEVDVCALTVQEGTHDPVRGVTLLQTGCGMTDLLPRRKHSDTCPVCRKPREVEEGLAQQLAEGFLGRMMATAG